MTKAIYDRNLEHRERRGERFAEQRRCGEEMLYNGTTLAERVRGAERIVEALWERSCMKIEGHRRAAEHPGYAEYLRMLDLKRLFGAVPGVVAELMGRYGLPIEGTIPPGDSYWHPGAKSKAGTRRRRARPPLAG